MSQDFSRRVALGILGLGREATTDEVRSATRRLVLEHHPDTGGEGRDLQRVLWARAQLLG